jgi:hypothetical protein
MMPNAHIMKVSTSGQMSIPAGARARWKARRVLVVDLGDHLVVRPMPEDPIGALQGKYAGRGPSSTEARREAREAEAAREGPRARR